MIFYYRWLTAETGHPCGICARLHGSLWHISRLPRPPHPHCRCRLVPVSFVNPPAGGGGGGHLPDYAKMNVHLPIRQPSPPRYTTVDGCLCSSSAGLNPPIVQNRPLNPKSSIPHFSFL